MFKKTLVLVITLISVVALLTACNNDTDKNANKSVNYESSKSLVLCVQQTSNTATPMLGDSEVSNIVYDTVRSSGATTILEVDGDCFTIDKVGSDMATNVSEAKKSSIAKQITKQILSIANSAIPKTAEIDVLKGLIIAARNLDKSCDEKTVLYLGSALQTTGYLPFASQNLFDTETDVIISQLKDKSAIPQFSEGTKVIFAGVGDTRAPQKNLTFAQIEKLKEILQAICEEGGASVDFITSTPLSDVNTHDFPPVSTVTVYDDYVDGDTLNGPLKIDSTQISFDADSYKLSDKSAAIKFLKSYVNSINASNDKIYICGTTATAGSSEECKEFSLKRAQTICDLLCEMGVDSSKLIPKGLGFENSFHVIDKDKNGVLNETAAQKNRLVLIIPASCDEASKI